MLENFVYGKEGFVKHQMFLGRPGSGKTRVCTMVLWKALARGLNFSITWVKGERAQQLGGEHVHKMFKFPLNKLLVAEVLPSHF